MPSLVFCWRVEGGVEGVRGCAVASEGVLRVRGDF